jgi:hypothetical protein
MNSLLTRFVSGILGLVLTSGLASAEPGGHGGHQGHGGHGGRGGHGGHPGHGHSGHGRHSGYGHHSGYGRNSGHGRHWGHGRPHSIVVVGGAIPGVITEGEVLEGETFSDAIEGSTVAQPFQTVRYLMVDNQTGERVRVYVQLSEEDRPTSWVFAPGENQVLSINDERLAASEVWIWAQSKTRRWIKHKEEAFVLVPEPYQADEIETATCTFR